MDEVILYSTDCPRCNVLKKKLDDKGIPFTVSYDVDDMIKLGFTTAPVLYAEGRYMEFSEANQWINGLGVD